VLGDDEVNNNKDVQGDNEVEQDGEENDDAALSSINVSRSDDPPLAADPMGPATEEELKEHDLPPVHSLCYHSLCFYSHINSLSHNMQGAHKETDQLNTKNNRELYELMQQNNITRQLMKDILHMMRGPSFGNPTIAESVHVLSEAGKVCSLTLMLSHVVLICELLIMYPPSPGAEHVLARRRLTLCPQLM
jgi:hypothetical protein